jgi:putative phage-type endonuclease
MILRCNNREEWLEERRKLAATASDAAAIIGFDPRRTALDVFVDKKSKSPDVDNDAMLIGRCLEDGIARVYAEKTGRPVYDPGDFTIWVHDDLPWLGATLDRLTWGETVMIPDYDPLVGIPIHGNAPIPGRPLQIKHSGWTQRSRWADDVPLWVQIQIQMEIACSNSPWGAYCGLVGGHEIYLGDLDRNDAFIEAGIEKLEEFKHMLDTNTPPPATSAKDMNAIKALYPEDSGETVELDAGALELVNQWQQFKADAKGSAEQASEYEAKIRALVGDATFGTLPDGTMVTLKTTKRKGYVREIKESTFRTLRRKNQ